MFHWLSTNHLPALILAIVLAAGTTPAALAEEANPHVEKQGAFADVFQDLKDAVINRGYVIDFVGHVDTMLDRTSGASKSVTETGSLSPYLNAKYLQFCSSKLTHEAVSANPYNMVVCPHVLFAFEAKNKPGHIVVGYRRPTPGPSKLSKRAFKNVDDVLMSIVKEAAGN